MAIATILRPWCYPRDLHSLWAASRSSCAHGPPVIRCAQLQTSTCKRFRQRPESCNRTFWKTTAAITPSLNSIVVHEQRRVVNTQRTCFYIYRERLTRRGITMNAFPNQRCSVCSQTSWTHKFCFNCRIIQTSIELCSRWRHSAEPFVGCLFFHLVQGDIFRFCYTEQFQRSDAAGGTLSVATAKSGRNGGNFCFNCSREQTKLWGEDHTPNNNLESVGVHLTNNGCLHGALSGSSHKSGDRNFNAKISICGWSNAFRCSQSLIAPFSTLLQPRFHSRNYRFSLPPIRFICATFKSYLYESSIRRENWRLRILQRSWCTHYNGNVSDIDDHTATADSHILFSELGENCSQTISNL